MDYSGILNRYVVALQAKCLFLLLKAFYFSIFPVLSSTCKTPAIFYFV